ncbi:hypothetical protein KIPB_010173, partial [Kipferlia bialata]
DVAYVEAPPSIPEEEREREGEGTVGATTGESTSSDTLPGTSAGGGVGETETDHVHSTERERERETPADGEGEAVSPGLPTRDSHVRTLLSLPYQPQPISPLLMSDAPSLPSMPPFADRVRLPTPRGTTHAASHGIPSPPPPMFPGPLFTHPDVAPPPYVPLIDPIRPSPPRLSSILSSILGVPSVRDHAAPADTASRRDRHPDPVVPVKGMRVEASTWVKGAMVTRGPDWRWGDQHGVEGVGRLLRQGSRPHELIVRWRSGAGANYRCGGPDSEYDLVYTGEGPLDEYRYDPALRVEGGDALRVGARVRRGHDWKYGNQDGGGTGTVLVAIGTHACKVRWDEGREDVYRCGRGGKYDLVYVERPQPRNNKEAEREGIRQAREALRVDCQLLRIGAAVTRGRDWKYGNQDDGETGIVQGRSARVCVLD